MRKRKQLLLYVTLLCGLAGSFSIPVFAQQQKETKSAADEHLNQKDAKGRKQGMWFYNIPAQFGDPGYMEFGAYTNDQKTGLWYKLTKGQQLISIENYKQGVLNGQAQYFENGRLYCIGTYRGIYSPYAYDTFLVRDPISMMDTLVATPAEKGYTRHGLWRYYNPVTGHLVREEEYQVDILLREKQFAEPQTQVQQAQERPKLPHEGGAHKGWNAGHSSTKKSLIK